MSIRRGWLWSSIVLAFCVVLGGKVSPAFAEGATCEPAKLAQKYPALVGKTIKISVAGDNKPFGFRDAKNFDLVGLVPDYAKAVFGCAGVPFEFQVATFSGGIAAVSSGQSDMIWSSVYYIPERTKVLDFVLYMKANSGGIVPKGNPKNFKSLDELCGHPTSAQVGSLELFKLQEVSANCVKAGKPASDIITSSDRSGGLRLLDNGRVDLYLGIGLKEAYPDDVDVAFLFSSDITIGIGTAKGNTQLQNALVEGITAMQANGTERKIYEKYEIDPSLTLKPTVVTK